MLALNFSWDLSSFIVILISEFVEVAKFLIGFRLFFFESICD